MRPWELHPALIHFPIAFLIGALIVEVTARLRGSLLLARVGAGLLVAGVASGIVAAAAGAVAYFTVPAHTEAAHGEMTDHLVLAGAALVLFAVVAVARWRHRREPASAPALLVSVAATGLLVGAAWLGGRIVYQGGAGVDPQILADEVVKGHHHHHDGDEAAEPQGEPADGHVDHDHDGVAGQEVSPAEPADGHDHDGHDHDGHDHAGHDHAEAPAARHHAPHRHTHLYDPSEGLDTPVRP